VSALELAASAAAGAASSCAAERADGANAQLLAGRVKRDFSLQSDVSILLAQLYINQ